MDDTQIYEYRGDKFLPIDTLVPEGIPFHHASSGSDQLSLQGTNLGSEQSVLPQNFYGSSSQQSSLSSSFEGVSAVPFSELKY